jgi:hypothetical protein
MSVEPCTESAHEMEPTTIELCPQSRTSPLAVWKIKERVLCKEDSVTRESSVFGRVVESTAYAVAPGFVDRSRLANKFMGRRPTPFLGNMLGGARPDGWFAHVLTAEANADTYLGHVQVFISEECPATACTVYRLFSSRRDSKSFSDPIDRSRRGVAFSDGRGAFEQRGDFAQLLAEFVFSRHRNR